MLERTRMCPMSEGATRQPSGRIVSSLGRVVGDAVHLAIDKVKTFSQATNESGNGMLAGLGGTDRLPSSSGRAFTETQGVNPATVQFHEVTLDNPLQTPVD